MYISKIKCIFVFEMDIKEIIDLNKQIRTYGGTNTFILSLQKQLKSTKTKKIEIDGKIVKALSDKQYEVAKTIL